MYISPGPHQQPTLHPPAQQLRGVLVRPMRPEIGNQASRSIMQVREQQPQGLITAQQNRAEHVDALASAGPSVSVLYKLVWLMQQRPFPCCVGNQPESPDAYAGEHRSTM